MKNYIFILSIFILFLSCNKNSKEKSIIIENNNFVRIWFDTVKVIPFKSTLIISKNKTFKYSSGACSYKSFSEGKWELNNDTIILNSIKPKKCFYYNQFGTICRTIDQIRKTKKEKSIKDCEPNVERDYEIFLNEKFYIKNDSLIHVKQNKLCEGFEFAYSPNEKTR